MLASLGPYQSSMVPIVRAWRISGGRFCAIGYGPVVNIFNNDLTFAGSLSLTGYVVSERTIRGLPGSDVATFFFRNPSIDVNNNVPNKRWLIGVLDLSGSTPTLTTETPSSTIASAWASVLSTLDYHAVVGRAFLRAVTYPATYFESLIVPISASQAIIFNDIGSATPSPFATGWNTPTSTGYSVVSLSTFVPSAHINFASARWVVDACWHSSGRVLAASPIAGSMQFRVACLSASAVVSDSISEALIYGTDPGYVVNSFEGTGAYGFVKDNGAPGRTGYVADTVRGRMFPYAADGSFSASAGRVAVPWDLDAGTATEGLYNQTKPVPGLFNSQYAAPLNAAATIAAVLDDRWTGTVDTVAYSGSVDATGYGHVIGANVRDPHTRIAYADRGDAIGHHTYDGYGFVVAESSSTYVVFHPRAATPGSGVRASRLTTETLPLPWYGNGTIVCPYKRAAIAVEVVRPAARDNDGTDHMFLAVRCRADIDGYVSRSYPMSRYIYGNQLTSAGVTIPVESLPISHWLYFPVPSIFKLDEFTLELVFRGPVGDATVRKFHSADGQIARVTALADASPPLVGKRWLIEWNMRRFGDQDTAYASDYDFFDLTTIVTLYQIAAGGGQLRQFHQRDLIRNTGRTTPAKTVRQGPHGHYQ